MNPSFEIRCEEIGKKFGREWIFKDFSGDFHPGESVAVLGNNGSGKSTFLMALSGFYALTKGNIEWRINGNKVEPLHWYKHYSLASPLLELPEDFTVDEFFEIHFQLKKMKPEWSKAIMFERTGLANAKNKFIKNLSSGMRQRLKLMLAFVPDVPVVFLDEPCTNLDEDGIALYLELASECRKQLLFVASNVKTEYAFCERVLLMEDLRAE